MTIELQPPQVDSAELRAATAAKAEREVLLEQRYRECHRRTREKGVNKPLYYLVRALFLPFFLIYFRLDRIGRERRPRVRMQSEPTAVTISTAPPGSGAARSPET